MWFIAFIGDRRAGNLLVLVVLLTMSCVKIPESSICFLNNVKPDSIPVIFAKDIISVKGRFETGITISPDGNSLAFGVAHESDPQQTNIYLMNFAKNKWSKPTTGFLSDNVHTFFPMFSPEGNKFYFVKSTDKNETDIWVAEYKDGLAINPSALNPVVNSSAREAGHGKAFSGALYFTSNRDDRHRCCGDVYMTKIDSIGLYSSVRKIDELSTDADEEGLFLSKNEDYMIIQAWENEYHAKHDLYLSYRKKNGRWTKPERLGTAINSKEMESRPFVTPDNKYLFFSRMSIARNNRKEFYESDIYWVSTKSIFKPYPYNTPIRVSLPYGKYFSLQLPKDLFKDVDDSFLTYQVALAGTSKQPEWLRFDPNTLMLTGVWKDLNALAITISVMDGYKNKTSTTIPVTLKM